jgi:hypothetical protein
MKKFIIALAAGSLVLLAGCTDSDTGTSGNTAAVVESDISKMDQALINQMTPEQKTAAINDARNAAESAARAAGQSDALVQQAGDAAAVAAKKALGVQ